MLGTTHNLVLFPSCLYLRVTSQKAVFLFLNIFRQELLIDSSVFCDLYSSISYLCVKSVAVLYLELCLETCLLLGRRLVTDDDHYWAHKIILSALCHFLGEKTIWICKSFFISARSLIVATTVAFHASFMAFTAVCYAISSAITFENTLTSTNTFQPCGRSQTDFLVHWNIVHTHKLFQCWLKLVSAIPLV